jgi:hypothetical protein
LGLILISGEKHQQPGYTVALGQFGEDTPLKIVRSLPWLTPPCAIIHLRHVAGVCE